MSLEQADTRRGLTFRSLNRASCFLRNRFSAMSAARLPIEDKTMFSKAQFYTRLRPRAFQYVRQRIEFLRTTGDFGECFATQSLPNFGQSDAFGVGKTQSRLQLRAQYSVLSSQVLIP